MIFKYGTFDFYGRHVKVSRVSNTPLRSQRGEPRFVERVLTIEGEVIDTTQAGLKTKIAAVETAVLEDGLDAIVYHQDGTTESAHSIKTADVSGVVRTLGVEWGDPTRVEYALRRTFRIGFRGLIPTLVTPTYLEYSETVELTGGGPRVVWDELLVGNPVSHETAAVTVATLTQSGRAIGVTAYPSAPGAIVSGSEIQTERSVGNFGPLKIDGVYTNYGTFWRYVMRGLPSALSAAAPGYA